jgi:PAS domain S-box-containing protein
MKILIAEDDADSRLVLQKNLEGAGHTVVAGVNGEDALEKARKSPPDLIISDILMPVMDGYKLCYEVKNDKTLNRIPFVFYTATYVDLEDEKLAIGLGASRYILKPVEPDKFLEMIDEVVREADKKEIIVPDEIVEDPLNLFRMYDSSVSRKLGEKIQELEIYRRVFENSTEAIAIVNREDHVVHQNPAQEKMIGYTLDELSGKTPEMYLDLKAVIAIRKGMEKGEPVRGEGVVTTRSGGSLFVEYIVFPIKDEKGNINNYVWMMRNCTKRVEAKRALRNERDKLEAITRGVGAGIALISKDYRTVWANQVIKDIFGDVEGKHCYEMYNQRDAVCPGCGVKEVFEKGAAEVVHEQVGKSVSGETVWSQIISTPLKDEKGNITAALEVVIDITGRKKAEENLRKAKKEWERTFDAISDVVTLQDTEMRIIQANKAACEVFGRPFNEIIGKLCYELFRSESEPCEGCPIPTTVQTFLPYTAEVEHKDMGKTFQITAVPILDEKGKVEGVAHFAKDITEQKSLVAQLLQAQKMEAIGTLAGGVAHDFNNMLTAIIGNVELAKLRFDPADPVTDELRQVESAAQRAAILVRQLLLFSRKQPMEFVSIDLNRTIEDLFKMLQRIIGEDVDLRMELCKEQAEINGDPGNIDQVVMNLAVNARDAMNQGGILSIKTETVSLDEEYCSNNPEARPGRFVCLSLTDNGEGMPESVRQHIFEPFFTTKGTGKGTGLGLAVVYGIVKSHNGWINVYSEPGQGTTFRVYFPFTETRADEEKEEEQIDIAQFQGKGENILLIEDDEATRNLAAIILQRHGYSVVAASTAEEALDFFFKKSDKKFDLVLSDVVLPGMNGIELIDLILEEKPDMPVLLCSGYADQKVHWPLIKQREIPFIEKPFAIAALLQKVKGVLDKAEKQ